MSLWQEIHNGFLDVAGLVSPNRNGGSLNGVMYTSEAIVIAARIGELDEVWKTYWKEVIAPCEIGNGVLMRQPGNRTSEEAPDDYYGYLAACKLVDPSRAKMFLWHGIKNAGFYNTDGKFSFSDNLWRQPGLISHGMFAAGFALGPFRLFFVFSLLINVWQNADASNQDVRRIGWLLIQTWDGKGILCRYAVNRWKTWLFSRYPQGMPQCIVTYYGPGHPFPRYIPKF